jgi:hypothetical protein
MDRAGAAARSGGSARQFRVVRRRLVQLARLAHRRPRQRSTTLVTESRVEVAIDADAEFRFDRAGSCAKRQWALLRGRPGREDEVEILAQLSEVEQPKRQLEVLRGEDLGALDEWPHWLCGSSKKNAQGSGGLRRMTRSSTATPLDLSMPVLPKRAKCSPSMSSLDADLDRGVLLRLPIVMTAAEASNTMRRLSPAQELDAVADQGIAGEAALEGDRAIAIPAHFAQQIGPGQPVRRAALARGFVAAIDVGDQCHDAVGVPLDAEELADRDLRRFAARTGVLAEADAGRGAADRDHVTGRGGGPCWLRNAYARETERGRLPAQ